MRVQLQLLLARQIPVRVKPVRVARGEKKFSRAVGFGQFGFRRFQNVARAASGPSEYFSTGTADGRRRGLIAFEQNGRNFDFFAVRGFVGFGFGFGGVFDFQRGGGGFKIGNEAVFQFSLAGRPVLTGLAGLSGSAVSSGRVGMARRKRVVGVSVFFLTDMVAGFLFITANPCFLAMTSLPRKSLRRKTGATQWEFHPS